MELEETLLTANPNDEPLSIGTLKLNENQYPTSWLDHGYYKPTKAIECTTIVMVGDDVISELSYEPTGHTHRTVKKMFTKRLGSKELKTRPASTSTIIEKVLKRSPVREISSASLVQEEIQNSKYILGLKAGWDGENAQPIQRSVYDASISFLNNYTAYSVVVNKVGFNVPEINPCKNGSVDISWRVNDYRLLVNIKESEDELLAFYYGDQLNKKTFIKGVVPATGVDESLASWMIKNLKA